MFRVLNFFIVGLLVGLAILYQHHRTQKLEFEIQSLRQQLRLPSEMVVPASKSTPAGPSTVSSESPRRSISTQQEISESRQNAITRAIARCTDAVVGITVSQVRPVRNPWLPSDPLAWMLFDERLWPRTYQKVENLGSGFIISSDGYIVTNEHVVRGATEVVVTTTTAKKCTATVVGTDPLLDMALLKIDDVNLPTIPFGDSENAIVGEWVIAMGNPYGLFNVNDQPSVSVGVISATHRDFASKIDGRIYSDMIQTDAAINRGNSGGPLLNIEGEAVGINTLIFSESGGSIGIGFAIPARRIIAAIDDLRKGPINRNYWIGIRVSDLTPTLARLHGLKSTSGVIVAAVDPGSPAAKAGVRVEDLILEMNEHPILTAAAAEELLANMDIRVGDQLSMRISRKGNKLNVVLSLTALPGPSRG